MTPPISLAIIGAGDRAAKYAEYVRRNPSKVRITAIAEPNDRRRLRMASEFGVPQDDCFDSWEELLRADRLADGVIISTPDHIHYAPALAAIQKGYHVLLEKPIAQSLEECIRIKESADKKGVIVGICHVLRYFPSYRRVKGLIQEGAIGEIISINHREPVGIDRMTHGFVRGEWNNRDKSNPMILSKACHDLDLIVWLTEDKCKSLESFGSLRWFHSQNAPFGSAERCLDCSIEGNCIFSAVDLYIRRRRWLRHFDSTDQEYIYDQLRNSDYGLCVYHSNNSVVDNQVVSMLMHSGTLVNFSMDVFTHDTERTTHIMGTKGEIKARENYFEYIDFASRTTHREDYGHLAGEDSFHSGADLEIVANFVEAIIENDPSKMTTLLDRSIESHRIAFEAEERRLSHLLG